MALKLTHLGVHFKESSEMSICSRDMRLTIILEKKKKVRHSKKKKNDFIRIFPVFSKLILYHLLLWVLVSQAWLVYPTLSASWDFSQNIHLLAQLGAVKLANGWHF